MGSHRIACHPAEVILGTWNAVGLVSKPDWLLVINILIAKGSDKNILYHLSLGLSCTRAAGFSITRSINRFHAIELSNFVHGETTSSLAKRMTNHPQKDVVRLTWPILCNCVLGKISPRHAVKRGQQWRRRWTFVARTYDGRRHWCCTLRLKLHWFDMLRFCCKLVCIVCRQRIDQMTRCANSPVFGRVAVKIAHDPLKLRVTGPKFAKFLQCVVESSPCNLFIAA